jgi:ribosomal protein S17
LEEIKSSDGSTIAIVVTKVLPKTVQFRVARQFSASIRNKSARKQEKGHFHQSRKKIVDKLL